MSPYSAHFWFFRIEQSRVRYMGFQNFHLITLAMTREAFELVFLRIFPHISIVRVHFLKPSDAGAKQTYI